MPAAANSVEPSNALGGGIQSTSFIKEANSLQMVYFGLGILYLIFGVVNFESLMYLCYLGSLCICGVGGNLRLQATPS